MFKIKLDAVEISKTQIALPQVVYQPSNFNCKSKGASFLSKKSPRSEINYSSTAMPHKCDGNIAKNIYCPYIFF